MELFQRHGIKNQHDALKLFEIRTVDVIYDNKNVKIKYYAKDNGSFHTLLLIHGWGANASIWGYLALELSDEFNIGILELPGHGLNSSLENATAYLTFEFTEKLLLSMVDAHTILVGHSMGGAIVQNFMLKHSVARSAVLVSTSSSFRTFVPPALMEFLLPTTARATEQLLRKIVNFLSPKIFKGGDLNEEIRKKSGLILAKDLLEIDENVVLTEYRNLIHSWDATTHPPFVVPALIVVGEQDRLTPLEQSEKMNLFYPNSFLKIIPGAQHNLPIFYYLQLANAIRLFVKLL